MYKNKGESERAAKLYDEKKERERIAAGLPSFAEECEMNAKRLDAEMACDVASAKEFARCNAEIRAAQSDVQSISSDADYQRMSPERWKTELEAAEARLEKAHRAMSEYYQRSSRPNTL